MNWKAHVARYFNGRNEGFLKVTGNHVHYKCSNISETCHYRPLTGIDIYGLSNSGNSDDLE